MRRLLLTAALACAAAVPFSPATAGPGSCTVTAGFPVCAGRCASGDTISVRVVGIGAGSVSCGGASASCYSFRVSCTASTRTSGSGALGCSGDSGAVVYCAATIAAT